MERKGPDDTLCLKALFRLILIVLGFNDTATLVGNFVSSPREREKRDEIVEETKEKEKEESG